MQTSLAPRQSGRDSDSESETSTDSASSDTDNSAAVDADDRVFTEPSATAAGEAATGQTDTDVSISVTAGSHTTVESGAAPEQSQATVPTEARNESRTAERSTVAGWTWAPAVVAVLDMVIGSVLWATGSWITGGLLLITGLSVATAWISHSVR